VVKILVLEDEPAVAQVVDSYLRRDGYETTLCGTVKDALDALRKSRPEMMILDVELPDGSGLDILRETASTGERVPAIVLTARGEESDRIVGLELGADDYITKPFSPRELLARINAVLRRSAPNASEERIEVEGLALDQASHRVLIGEETVGLGPTEYRMLEFFMTHPERVYSRDQLLDRIWGGNVYVEERTIDVHIRRLRKALEDFGYDRFIQTVRGSGYRFSAR
jgi:two-component system, OmpR family, phosphate regulon response regulator PhoB